MSGGWHCEPAACRFDGRACAPKQCLPQQEISERPKNGRVNMRGRPGFVNADPGPGPMLDGWR
jgi:hypothetical protein